jgi:hypothetical protein
VALALTASLALIVWVLGPTSRSGEPPPVGAAASSETPATQPGADAEARAGSTQDETERPSAATAVPPPASVDPRRAVETRLQAELADESGLARVRVQVAGECIRTTGPVRGEWWDQELARRVAEEIRFARWDFGLQLRHCDATRSE